MEKIIMLLDKFVQYVIVLMDTEMIYFKPIDVLVIAAFAIGMFFFIKHAAKGFFKYGAIGAVEAGKPIKALYAKNKQKRRNKIICPVCKNPLSVCTCRSNRNVPYRARYKKWKANQKKLNELNKPVALKTKRRG